MRAPRFSPVLLCLSETRQNALLARLQRHHSSLCPLLISSHTSHLKSGTHVGRRSCRRNIWHSWSPLDVWQPSVFIRRSQICLRYLRLLWWRQLKWTQSIAASLSPQVLCTALVVIVQSLGPSGNPSPQHPAESRLFMEGTMKMTQIC